jgi:hypothetical protein
VPATAPIPSLGNTLIRPRPLIAVRLTGPADSRAYDGFLDTGADDTVFTESYAAVLGIDLSQAATRPLGLAGRHQIVPCRYAQAEIGITDGIESYVWTAIVGFVPITMHYCLLGYAGFLQFFDVAFHGADREAVLLPNRDYRGTGP